MHADCSREAVVCIKLVVHAFYKQGCLMLNPIFISALNSHQSTNHVLLYKRALCTEEASGMEILAVLVHFFR